MPCSVCGHTMHNLGVSGQRIFWCPRCGTLKDNEGTTFENNESPRWTKMLAAAKWHEVQVEVSENQEITAALDATLRSLKAMYGETP